MDPIFDTLVEEIMVRDLCTIRSDASNYDAAYKMVDQNVGSLLVVEDDYHRELKRRDILGMIPIFFTLKFLLNENQGKDIPVADSMFAEVNFIKNNAPISTALQIVTSNKTWRLIVIDKNDYIVGFISITDIMRYIRNAITKHFSLELETDTDYYALQFRWKGNHLKITRGEEFVANFADATSVSYIEDLDSADDQSMVLLSIVSEGKKTNLFIDADPIQTNAREVSPELGTIEEVLEWLLPKGYFCRQGDIAFYTIDSIPEHATKVPVEEYEEYFEIPFHKRHCIVPKDVCEYFVAKPCAYYMRVLGPASIVHPEHRLVDIPQGCVEVKCANGTPLPKILGLKENEQFMR